MKFKFIGRALKAVAKGVIKVLPFANVVQEIKGLKLKDAAEKVKHMTSNNTEIDQRLYYLLDIIDDGKANDSFDEELIYKFLELAVNFAGGAAALIWIFNNL